MNAKNIEVLPTGLRTVACVPGSKSYTNRALLLAAMTKGSVRIERPLLSDDTRAMIGCLRVLGIEVRDATGAWEVTGDIGDVKAREYELDADLSGITIRFLLALSAVIPGAQTLQGKAGLNKRPIGELVEALRQLGADIEYVERDGFPPVRVRSHRLRAGTVTMPGGLSSQYFSAMLQVAPLTGGEVVVEVQGEQISRPYIDMTIDTMRQFGVAVENAAYQRYRVVSGQRYVADRYVVEGDFSSAGYFFAVAALTGSTITVRNVNPRSVQADRKLLEILKTMGSVVKAGDGVITVAGRGVMAGDFDMQDLPDQAMTVAVLAAFAPGVTTIRGVRSLRVKETERVKAVEQELAKMGIRTESTQDTLTIYGGDPKPATIDTYGDHRMAMAFAVAGTKLPGMVIRDPGVVSKTFPEFWQALRSLTERNVVLIGMRGAGKSTVGRRLAARLGKRSVDMDTEIAAREGVSIDAMVKAGGWDRFRAAERRVAAEVGAEGGLVVAAGGGVVLDPRNVAELRRRGTCVWLKAPVAVLAARIRDGHGRPPLTTQTTMEAELAQVWQQRRGLYAAAADMVVETGGRTAEEVAVEIYKMLGDRQ